MGNIAISGTGVFTPEESITNAELVKSYNAYAKKFNEINKDKIDVGETDLLESSNEEFIFNASGIEKRYVVNKSGILDPDIMHPIIRKRTNDEPSILAEMSIKASRKAMKEANKTPDDIDAVITACSNLERAYPAIAIEVQNLLGIYSNLSSQSIDKVKEEFQGKNFSIFKNKLSELLVDKINPIGKRIKDLLKDENYLDKILAKGSQKANNLATKKINEIKTLVGF